MRSHKQNRRARGNKPQEDDQYGASRMDEGSDSYSRSHRATHRSDDHRTPSTSSRDYFDGYRETGPHPRNRPDEDAWFSDARGYREEDVYRRDDDYDVGMRRDSDWGTRPASDSQYPSVREDWSHQQYTHPSSYPDSSSWDAATSRDAYDSRASYYEDWSTPNPRSSTSRPRDDDRYPQGVKQGRKDSGWSQDPRRDREVQQPHQHADSGWEGRRRDNGWEDKMPEDTRTLEERAWEPAPSWKSSHRTDNDNQHRNQHQNDQRNSQHRQQHHSRGGKRNHNPKQQRRDWRNDDSHLNKYGHCPMFWYFYLLNTL